ncbi:MAG: FecR family protein, partial [Elusimicrobiales bacterium]|nr:FecR family protein [Elusimicrobiales bacterium]
MACTLLFATHIESIAAEQIKIGVAASVQDTVQSIREKRIRLKSGMDIYLNDRIVTGKTGSLQIMLLDETIFTLGPNSDMVLDEFVYDPSNDKGKVSAKVAKGVFRFITGKIARHDPSNMNVKIQAGNIGIRGTIVAGRTGPEGSTVILAGPGVKNNAGERPGAIIVSGDQKSWFSKNSTSASQQYINTPGEGTTVSPEGYVSKPRMMQKELAELNGLLGYKPKTVGKNNKGIKAETKAELEEDGEELNDKSGQNDADKKEEAADKENKQNITDSANSDIMQGSQEKAISDTTENSKKALLYAELPYLGISRASYQTRSEISGTKNDGSTIKRGLLFGTVVNFIDQYFQNTYLKITSAENNDTKYAAYPDGDTGSSYYAMEPDGDKASFSWGGTLSSYKGGNTSYYEDPDPDVTYGDVNVNMQLFNTAANPMPSLTADIKVYNDDNELLLAGIYDMNGSLYTGKFTNGEMLKYA